MAATLVNGTGTFVASLTLAGNQTLTVTDPAASLTATNTIAVSAAAATKFAVGGTPTSNVVAGTSFTFTVTALDPYNNPASYSGTVHFSSTDTDAQTHLPGNSILTNGTGTFNATLTAAGVQTITATDTVTSSFTGTSSGINVIPVPAKSLVVTLPVNVPAGTPFTVKVTAEDQYGNVATAYAGTIHFSSTAASAATLPANYIFSASDHGVHSFTVTLTTAGLKTLTVADTAATALTATNPIIVSGAATHFSITGVPTISTAGSSFNFTETALDALNDTTVGYTGTVHFTSNDPIASLPANITLSYGVGSFSASLKTAGAGMTITATDTANAAPYKGTTVGTTVAAGLTSKFIITTPATAAVNTAFSITVKAADAFGNPTTPTVHFSSTAGRHDLARQCGFAGRGQHLRRREIDESGAPRPSRSWMSARSTIPPLRQAIPSSSTGAATQLVIQSTSASVTAGTSVTYKVIAKDSNGDTALGYRGTVHFVANGDPKAVLPVNYAFSATDSGVHTFTVIYKTAGTPTLTFTDTVTGTITGQNGSVTVTPAAASKLVLDADFLHQPHRGQLGHVQRDGPRRLRQPRLELRRHGRVHQLRREGRAACQPNADQRRRFLQPPFSRPPAAAPASRFPPAA